MLAAYFLEAGLVLIVAPWSSFWERNFFVERLPGIGNWLGSPVVRGAVSGVGLVTALAGLAEFGGAFGARRPNMEGNREPTVHPDR